MLTKEKILFWARGGRKILGSELAQSFKVSRQYVNQLIRELIKTNNLTKIGSTKKSFYVLSKYADKYQMASKVVFAKTYKNHHLEELAIFDRIEKELLLWRRLPENVYSIFTYAFSEMLNNAIDHSQSKLIKIKIFLSKRELMFIIDDFGIGVFRSIARKKHLNLELDAIGELLKGKITTMPKAHSGEGIFFTGRVSDELILNSYGYQLIFDNKLPDIFINQLRRKNKGTEIIFKISLDSKRHLKAVFDKYADLTEDGNYGFDKTEIKIRLYDIVGVYMSRSQARRILAGLEKFRIIVFDYYKVPMVGQAFADEIYRVFHNKYPKIKIEETNMNGSVKFMVDRAKHEARKK